MKKSILVLAAFTFLGAAIITSCNTPAEKVENAQENVAEANKDLQDANEAYIADLENYRKEQAEKIAENDKNAAAFRARIEKEKKEIRADYYKKIADLEKKNSDMKKKMDDYKAEGKEKWETFKAEFTHDMTELAIAFKDLTVKNNKL